MHKPFLAWFLALCLAGALTGTSALPAFLSADKHICPPSENGAEVAVRNAGGRLGVVFLSQATRTEHWPSGGSGSWNNPNNKATGSQCFAEGMTKADAYGPEHFGNFLLKLDCKTKTGGAAAIILALPDGHIALGAPRADMETNGEVVFASSLALTGSAARLAAHDQPIPFARPRSDCDSNEERAATRAAIQMGTLQPEGKLCLPTRAQLRSGGEALSQVIAARGFVMRFGGLGTLVLLFATEGHTAGHVERQARLLGAGAHSHESKDSKKWMAFALIGAPGTAAVGRDQEEQLQAIATIHRKNGEILRDEEDKEKADALVAARTHGGAGEYAKHGGRTNAAYSIKGGKDSKTHGERAGPEGFAAVNGAKDSKTHGKRTGPEGFAAAGGSATMDDSAAVTAQAENKAKRQRRTGGPFDKLEAIYQADKNFGKRDHTGRYAELVSVVAGLGWDARKVKDWFLHRRRSEVRQEARREADLARSREL